MNHKTEMNYDDMSETAGRRDLGNPSVFSFKFILLIILVVLLLAVIFMAKTACNLTTCLTSFFLFTRKKKENKIYYVAPQKEVEKSSYRPSTQNDISALITVLFVIITALLFAIIYFGQ